MEKRSAKLFEDSVAQIEMANSETKIVVSLAL